jgi:hypothetical protein
MTHVIEPNAAGIDVGSPEMYVAVPVDRDPQSVRRFSTFTNDLIGLADWLVSHQECCDGVDADHPAVSVLFGVIEKALSQSTSF